MSASSDYARNVGALLAQEGEVRGREAANKGAIWGGAIASIGDFIGQYPKQKAQMEEIKNRAALTDLERQKLEREKQKDTTDAADEQKIRDLFNQAHDEFQAGQSGIVSQADGARIGDAIAREQAAGTYQGPQRGASPTMTPTPQPKTARTSPIPTPSEILRVVGPKKGIPIINGLAALKQDPQGDPEKSLKLLQQVANGLNALPEDMRAAAYPDIVKSFEQRGIIKQGVLPPVYDSTHWKFIMGTGQAPPKPSELKPVPGPDGKPVYGTPQAGQPVYEKPGATPGEAKVGSFEDYVTRTYGANPTSAQVLAARKAYGQADDRPRIDVNVSGNSDVKETVKGMKEGTIPPQLPGRASKEYTALMAEAHRQGFDLSTAATDWQATQKHIATLNGAQQTRMAQAIDNAGHSLDVIEDLANQWDGGKFPPLNKARLAMAKNGALGAKAQQIATNLEAQISDVTSELGNVYMGGNSPTDHALDLASKNLSADWTRDQLKSALGLARRNLTIRQNSMRNVGVAGASPTNPYGQQPAAPAVAPPTGRYNPKTGKIE